MEYTAKNGLTLNLDYYPEVLVEDITKLTNAEWLQARRNGIGGSDCGIIYGVSEFRTIKDLYYDKIGKQPIIKLDDKKPFEDPALEELRQRYNGQQNWFRLEVGHRLEELVAAAFAQKTGCEPYAVRKMFRHPFFPWLLADVDYFVDIPDEDGIMRTYILEIKTTSYMNKKAWGDDFAPTIPQSYVLQGIDYMATCNVSGVIYACCFDNNEESIIIRKMERDLDAEADLILKTRDFWLNNVEALEEPGYTDGDCPEAIKACMEKWSEERPLGTKVDLNGVNDIIKIESEEYTLEQVFARYEMAEQKIEEFKKMMKPYEEMSARYKAILQDSIGNMVSADVTTSENFIWKLGYTQVCKKDQLSKANLERLKMEHPKIYKYLKDNMYLSDLVYYPCKIKKRYMASK